jgi:ketosteroid isomerase-like protein
MPDTEPNLFTMLRNALGARVDPKAANFRDLMSEDFVMEFPYARPGMQPRIEGRAAVAAYLSTVGDGIAVDSLADIVVHETTDTDVVILEFTGRGRALKTGEPYENRYISVIRTRHGRVVHWKDYWNPLEGLKARLGGAAVDEFLRSEPPDSEHLAAPGS